MSRPPFAISTRPTDSATVVAVAGEVDIATTPQVVDVLEAVRRDGPGRCVVDLGECTFIDSSATRALVGAAQSFRAAGADLMVACPTENRAVRMVLEMLGVDQVLQLRDRL